MDCDVHTFHRSAYHGKHFTVKFVLKISEMFKQQPHPYIEEIFAEISKKFQEYDANPESVNSEQENTSITYSCFAFRFTAEIIFNFNCPVSSTLISTLTDRLNQQFSAIDDRLQETEI